MNLLSWIFILELLLLLSAYIAWWAGKQAARERPDDALYRFAAVFWRTYRQKPLPLRAPVLDDEEGEGEAVNDADIGEAFGNSEDRQTEEQGRGGANAPVIRQSTLNVRIIAQAQRDQIVGMEGYTLKVQVMAEAESGAANKAVIDLLITTLGIKTHQILLVRGHFQTQKVFQISGLSEEELDRKLAGYE